MADNCNTLLINTLKSKTKYYKDILKLLSSETVLCGGLVLQSLTKQTWDTDIDIFTTDVSFKSLPFGSWKKLEKKLEYIVIPGVINIYTGCVDDTKIDIIHITNFEELFSGFDFDFCQVWFDGQEIHINYPESVENKMCTVKQNPINMRNFEERADKYRKRGFTINLDLAGFAFSEE